jgi:ribonuclease HII
MSQLELFSCSTSILHPHWELQEIAQKDPAALEGALRSKGIFRFAGIDEAGRGPIAGPVVACACIFPPGECDIQGITDSKQLSEEMLERIYGELVRLPGMEFGVSIVDPEIIDRINIVQATFLAMRQAVAQLKTLPEFIIVDGNLAPQASLPCVTVVKGDIYCRSISAASILAKVTRDRLMKEYDSLWPLYGFAEHKGYGTPRHLKMLEEHGPCPLHRKSFAPVQSMIAPQQLSFPFLQNLSSMKLVIEGSRKKKKSS